MLGVFLALLAFSKCPQFLIRGTVHSHLSLWPGGNLSLPAKTTLSPGSANVLQETLSVEDEEGVDGAEHQHFQKPICRWHPSTVTLVAEKLILPPQTKLAW